MWIWLDKGHYPNNQKTTCSNTSEGYCIAQFVKKIPCAGAASVKLVVSADTAYRMYVNGKIIAQGPSSCGGDFHYDGKEPLGWYYKDTIILPDEVVSKGELDFNVLVQLSGQAMPEYSCGQGGLYIDGFIAYPDGREEKFETDESWMSRVNEKYPSPAHYDGTRANPAFIPAVATGDTRVLTDSKLKNRDFDVITSPDGEMYDIKEGETIVVKFERIYASYILIASDSDIELDLHSFEDNSDGNSGSESVKLAAGDEYTSMRMYSTGGYRITSVKGSARLRVRTLSIHYPFANFGTVDTSDKGLDLVFDLCRHTLGICRQTIHLDSPSHQEPLACTGDYYIETLMTLFTYGDLSLARADVIRTANFLVRNNGDMFHTSYSLIWVQMLDLVYRYTDDSELLTECREALNRLFNAFATYQDSTGLIVDPPDYMFIDWMVTDGYSMHHPPRYLGQAALNAFYYGALVTGARLGGLMGWEESMTWEATAVALKPAFDKAFWHPEYGLYCDGNDTPVEGRKNDFWKPEYSDDEEKVKADRIHYGRYSNILAALYGLCGSERAVRLIMAMADDDTRMPNGEIMPPVQPYFMNFLLQAVEKYSMADCVGMKLLSKWIPVSQVCQMGLQEGWYAPEEGYGFDHSHAWGGAPAYFIPQMLTGFRLEENGYRKISLSPNLMGLNYANVHLPTPYGYIDVKLEAGKEPEIKAPEGIEVTIR